MTVSPRDLRLRITRSSRSDVYLVTLTPYDSDTPLAEETVEGFQPTRLKSEYLVALHAYAERAFPQERLEAMGREIARLLLPERVRLNILSQFLQSPTTPVRLFVTTARPELAAVPWEYTFVEADGQALERSGFLCRHPYFHLIRQPAAPIRVQPSTDRKLRVLLAWADPATGKYARLPHLQDELRSVQTALGGPECRHIEIEPLPSATRAGMERCLREFRPHILHFVGHGDALPTGGVLILESGQPGVEERLYAEELAEWLKRTPCKLVTLSACHTASPERGLAATLSAQGVPAVVGMQLPMRSATASLFTRAFYSGLIQTQGVEEALSQARHMTDESMPDWGVPSLYLANTDSVLFPNVQSGASSVPFPPKGIFHVPYPQNPYFLGRDEKLEQLHQRLQADAGPPVALAGIGGLGKTQLAVEYAHRYRKQYPGGVYWIHARDTSRLQDEYAALSRLFDVPETLSTEERAQRMRALLHEIPERALLVFDNITEKTDLSLLPVTGQCRVVVTTRLGYIAEPNFRILPVPVLNDTTAETLLRRMGREPSDGQDEEDMRDIVALLGGLPLALALVAHHVRRLGVRFGEYLAYLQERPQETLERARLRFITATQHDGSLFDTLEISRRVLSPAAQRAFSTLGCFAGRGISPELLYRAFAGGSDHDQRSEFHEALAELRDYYFVEREADQRLTVHELTRTFAQGQMTEDAQRDAVGRVAGVLTDCLSRANETMDWRSARREIVHCRSAEALCRKVHASRNHGGLLHALGLYCEAHGEYDAATDYLSANLALTEQSAGRQSAEAACLMMQIGNVSYDQGDSPAALRWQRDALAIAEACLSENDARLIAHYSSIGVILKSVQEFEEAAWYLYKALALSERVHGRQHMEYAISLNNIGTLLESQGRLEEALTHLEEAMTIDRAIFGPQHPNVAIRLNSIGRILSEQGRFGEALTRHREALQIVEQAFGRRHPDFAASLYYCGKALAALGQKEEARTLLMESLDIYIHFSGPDHPRTNTVRKSLQALKDQEDQQE